jgi:hypothetical protein
VSYVAIGDVFESIPRGLDWVVEAWEPWASVWVLKRLGGHHRIRRTTEQIERKDRWQAVGLDELIPARATEAREVGAK